MSNDRGHLYRPLTDEQGTLLYGATVALLDPTTLAPITDPIYDSNDGLKPRENPWIASTGSVDVWLDNPRRVVLSAQYPGRAPVTVPLDILPPATQILRVSSPMVITNAPAAGQQQMLNSDGQGNVTWSSVPTPSPTSPHYHQGTGANSVALGTGASAPGAGTVAVGDNSTAATDNSTAYGFGAQALGNYSTALGAQAITRAGGGVAIGYTAVVNDTSGVAIGRGSVSVGVSATAVGAYAQATGLTSLAVGKSAIASGDGSTAIGNAATASGSNSIAIGAGAQAAFESSGAIGPGASAPAANQFAFGVASTTSVFLGALIVNGSATVGDTPTDVVGFFGGAGATRQTVTGSRSGSQASVLADLLTYLDALGLISNQTTP